MIESELITLWGSKFTPARGLHWVSERKCSLETAPEWLKIFKKDEPDRRFVISKTKPRKLPA